MKNMQEKSANNYDDFAEDFSRTRNRRWEAFDYLFPLIRSESKLLDLGCGNGRLRQFLDADTVKPENYTGMDASKKLIKIAQQKHPQSTFKVGDFRENLPYPDASFDIVTAIASFHHLTSKPEQLFFLRECNRVLKPNGIIFITVWRLPLKFLWNNLFQFRWKNWVIPYGVSKIPRIYRRVNKSELQSLFTSEGFSHEKSILSNRNIVSWGKKKTLE